MPVTRLAPSPTGALHLGNARTLLINWLLARKNGWKVVLRIEDLDGPRIKKNADKEALADLRWMGIDWDEGPIYQSSRFDVYRNTIQQLTASGKIYPCICSRSEVSTAASAPHAEDGAAVYPGTCDDRFTNAEEARNISGRDPALRFRVPDKEVQFMDLFAGRQHFNPARQLGDFVIAKADGTPSYQLAVVVDDAEMEVSHVVRGDDLLDSTPRQIVIYQALGLTSLIPQYCHLPLIVGTDGRRLAKRHGDTRLSYYRNLNVPPERIIALLARWSGMGEFSTVSIKELLSLFEFSRVPHQKVIFSEEDDSWLRGYRN
jgi:glutamyl-tRNA synthetase